MKRIARIFGYGNDRKDNIFLFAMQLVVFTLPAYFGFVNSWAIVLLFLVWLFTNDFSTLPGYLKKRSLGWFFIGYFIWSLIAISWSENKDVAWVTLGHTASFLVLPFLLLYSNRIVCRHLRGVIRVFYWTNFVLSIIMLGLAGISYYNHTPALAHDLDYFTYEKLALQVGIQPIYLAMYMVFSMFAVWWDFFLQPKVGLTKEGKVMAGIWIFHFYMMIVLLSSRMELLIMLLLASVLILWLELKKSKKRWPLGLFKVLVLGSVTIILIGVFPVNKARYEEMIDLNKDYTQNRWGGRAIRIQKWLNTFELIAEQPFLGTGTGDLQDELQKVYKKNHFELAYVNKFNPHNQYLQTWATYGIPGLFFLLGIIVVSLRYAWGRKNPLYFILIFLLAFSMITESILERQKGVVFFSFFLLLFAAYYLNEKERNIER